MICENCSIEHDGIYGSGRFCSSKCARGFSTKSKRTEINKRVSQKLLGRPRDDLKGRHMSDVQKYKLSKALTGRKISESTRDKMRNRKATDATRKKLSQSLKGKTGGWRPYSGAGKRGYVHGIHYQSSWEYAYIQFCVNNGILIENYKNYFMYTYDGKQHKYYPDFYLPETDEIVEIKGYWKPNTDAKIESVKSAGRKITVIGKNEIQKYL